MEEKDNFLSRTVTSHKHQLNSVLEKHNELKTSAKVAHPFFGIFKCSTSVNTSYKAISEIKKLADNLNKADDKKNTLYSFNSSDERSTSLLSLNTFEVESSDVPNE